MSDRDPRPIPGIGTCPSLYICLLIFCSKIWVSFFTLPFFLHLCALQANELGMMSAFYKYILTTMDFPLLQLDDVVGDQSNIVGFSMLNTSHPFYLEFIRSLNLSWKEGCNINPYPGPA
ncbi:Glutamate receptor ionotropic, kainate 5, partial [Characodon lateralis]|nr:Glutamate receptor ionotropic, kainate 5 [Characodon lateralis]